MNLTVNSNDCGWKNKISLTKKYSKLKKKKNPLGFVVIEPEHLKFKHEMIKNKKKETLSKSMQYKPKTQKATWRFS